MKTSILTLAIALAFSFTTTPAAAKVTAQQKCDAGKQTATAKHQQCRTLAEAKNTKKPDPTKLTASHAKCDTKLENMFAKFEGKTPEDATAAAEDQCSNYGDFEPVLALNTVVSDAVADGSASTEGIGALATSNDQSVCEAADGTWENNACTPAVRDCFHKGICGRDGFNAGAYDGLTMAASGCDATTQATVSYNQGVTAFQILVSQTPCALPPSFRPELCQ